MSNPSNQDLNDVSKMSETEALAWVSALLESYRKMANDLKSDYDKLMSLKADFPIKYIDTIDFEELTLRASHAKFRAIQLNQKLEALESEADHELNYVISNFELNIADDALSEKFDKVTESLRKAYMNSKKEIKDLSKLKERVKNLAKSSEKLIRMFDTDEIHFRRFVEKKNKLNGFN